MNNGKVRIYELSKELNLENKELLAICDQLNIAVKSHSSTITESDAERIRSQAEKLTALGLSKHGTNNKGSGNGASAPNKPQILEIRSKPKPPKNSNSADSAFKPPQNDLDFQHSASASGVLPQSNNSSVSSIEPVAPTAPVSQITLYPLQRRIIQHPPPLQNQIKQL